MQPATRCVSVTFPVLLLKVRSNACIVITHQCGPADALFLLVSFLLFFHEHRFAKSARQEATICFGRPVRVYAEFATDRPEKTEALLSTRTFQSRSSAYYAYARYRHEKKALASRR